jgi:hypothetical protein
MLRPWMNLAIDATLLGMEVQPVVGIHALQITFGQGTPAETQLMNQNARPRLGAKDKRPSPLVSQAAFTFTAASARRVKSSSVFFSSCRVSSRSFAASFIPSWIAHVLSVPYLEIS